MYAIRSYYAVQGADRYNVLDTRRLELYQQLLHPRGFELEHPRRLPGGQQAVGIGVVIADDAQIEIRVFPFADKTHRIVDDGEGLVITSYSIHYTKLYEGAGKVPAAIAVAGLVHGVEVSAVAPVCQADLATAGEQGGASRVAGRNDAVEHVHAPFDALKDVLGQADSH